MERKECWKERKEQEGVGHRTGIDWSVQKRALTEAMKNHTNGNQCYQNTLIKLVVFCVENVII